jgi:hypothetical protein
VESNVSDNSIHIDRKSRTTLRMGACWRSAQDCTISAPVASNVWTYRQSSERHSAVPMNAALPSFASSRMWVRPGIGVLLLNFDLARFPDAHPLFRFDPRTSDSSAGFRSRTASSAPSATGRIRSRITIFIGATGLQRAAFDGRWALAQSSAFKGSRRLTCFREG